MHVYATTTAMTIASAALPIHIYRFVYLETRYLNRSSSAAQNSNRTICYWEIKCKALTSSEDATSHIRSDTFG